MTLLREPLLHFTIAGAVMFGGYAWLEPRGTDLVARRADQDRRRAGALASGDVRQSMAKEPDRGGDEGSPRDAHRRGTAGAGGARARPRPARHRGAAAAGAKAEFPRRRYVADRRSVRGRVAPLPRRARGPLPNGPASDVSPGLSSALSAALRPRRTRPRR